MRTSAIKVWDRKQREAQPVMAAEKFLRRRLRQKAKNLQETGSIRPPVFSFAG
jgi:hypothetical protein